MQAGTAKLLVNKVTKNDPAIKPGPMNFFELDA